MYNISTDSWVVVVGNSEYQIGSANLRVIHPGTAHLRRSPASKKRHGVQEMEPCLPGLGVRRFGGYIPITHPGHG